MDFDTKVFDIFIIIFQMKVISQQNDFFQHNYVHLNGKLIQMFFVKSYESNCNSNGTINSCSIYSQIFHQVLKLFESFKKYIDIL
jgi:hypothetical protein